VIEKVPLTADIPAVRAAFKERPEDFVVDEVAAGAPPPGEGYAWVRIEKRGIATDEAIRRIAGRLGRDEHAIGYAGRKDAQGITRQWLSIAGAADPEALRAAIDDADVRLLEAVPAGRKIKLGELAGNRFVLRLRGVSEIDERRAREVLARLRLLGAPASFGAQRFGIRGNSHEIGRAILLGRSRDALDLLLGRPAEAEGPRLRAARAAY
jgi:tRNA pseudouridine13 synthase